MRGSPRSLVAFRTPRRRSESVACFGSSHIALKRRVARGMAMRAETTKAAWPYRVEVRVYIRIDIKYCVFSCVGAAAVVISHIDEYVRLSGRQSFSPLAASLLDCFGCHRDHLLLQCPFRREGPGLSPERNRAPHARGRVSLPWMQPQLRALSRDRQIHHLRGTEREPEFRRRQHLLQDG